MLCFTWYRYSPAGNVFGSFADNVTPPNVTIPEANPTSIAEGAVLNETSCWKSKVRALALAAAAAATGTTWF
jgi:hypothetical protein